MKLIINVKGDDIPFNKVTHKSFDNIERFTGDNERLCFTHNNELVIIKLFLVVGFSIEP